MGLIEIIKDYQMSLPHVLTVKIFHLTCHEVGPDEDPPEMRGESDPGHDAVAKFVCPFCNHKVLVDVVLVPKK